MTKPLELLAGGYVSVYDVAAGGVTAYLQYCQTLSCHQGVTVECSELFSMVVKSVAPLRTSG